MIGGVIAYDVTKCRRCGGSGRHSRSRDYGTTCFTCHGSGQMLTPDGAKACSAVEDWKLVHASVPADQLRAGQRVLMNPHQRSNKGVGGPAFVELTAGAHCIGRGGATDPLVYVGTADGRVGLLRRPIRVPLTEANYAAMLAFARLLPSGCRVVEATPESFERSGRVSVDGEDF